MPEWDAEVAVDGPLVRALIGEQFPQLDASSARVLGEGWDNSVWVVEERWAFRFPRREIAIPGVKRELALLPGLAPLLPAAIPAPTFVGEASDRFPWPFFGAALLRGVEPAETEVSDDERGALATELGTFLRALHAPETLEAVDPDRSLPVDFNRRADMPFRVARLRERLRELPHDIGTPTSSLEVLLAEAEGLGPSSLQVLVHGDLHIRHVLLDGGSLSGVIDWGDACRADPAVDLMLIWMLLPPAARERFVSSYGPVDHERLLRARVLAAYLGVVLAVYARDVGNARLEREIVLALERTLSD